MSEQLLAMPPGGTRRDFPLHDVSQARLFREQFPYDSVPRIVFDGQIITPEPPDEIWLTDTTFRDGQQARPPYTPEQIIHLYKLLHKLGGRKGIVRQCEFFLYSKRDRKAVEGCLEKGYKFPEVTGWIRANADDFKLVKALGLKETGILTSVSDYHIFLKLNKSRRKALDGYLAIVKSALEEGIVPRCHFEDVTRADIYGFCLPFAKQLLKLSEESGMPIKIRLCDTMGYGVTYPGAALPRSVAKLAYAFRHEAGFPSHLLEWHGHNDFHKVHINGTTSWLYGISALNASLLGYGERTGNPPLEGAIMEYIGLKGKTHGINTRVISEIADYFREVVKADVPKNYPFVGEEFNTTRAGIHADGLLKNPEIYNIFDTDKVLGRPIMVNVTDKSGVAGIAHWLNSYAARVAGGKVEPISKRHPGVRRIYEWVAGQYSQGRTTAISPDEMVAQAKRHVPRVFESDFVRVRTEVEEKARLLAEKVTESKDVLSLKADRMEPVLRNLVRNEPFMQLVAVTDLNGKRISQVHAQRGEKGRFRALLNRDFSEQEWFRKVVETGEVYCSHLFVSRFTEELIMTVAVPLRGRSGKVRAVLDVDFKFEEMVKLLNTLPEDVLAPE